MVPPSDNEPDTGALMPTVPAGGLLTTVGEWLSGVPRAFHAPLLKAANRLLLGIVNVPAAALEAKADDIKHKQQMRRKMRAALVAQAAASISDKQDLTDRAVNFFVNDVIGKQENREAVLQHAAEELTSLQNEHGLPRAVGDVDDDWLDAFARYAENASSERLRALFGRVLAGELRKPGAYSLFTLDFLAKLGQQDAALMTQIAPYVIWNMIVLTKASRSVLDFGLSSTLGALNIVTATSIGVANAITTFRTEENVAPALKKPCAMLSTDHNVFLIATPEPKEFTVECIVLTHIGSEVLSLHVCDPDPQMLKELATDLKKQDAELYVGDVLARDANTIQWRNLRLIATETAEA